MSSSQDTLTIHVNVQISAETLQTIVTNAKRIAGRDASGVFHVDTADQVSAMISRFLVDKDFEQYVKDPNHYPDISG